MTASFTALVNNPIETKLLPKGVWSFRILSLIQTVSNDTKKVTSNSQVGVIVKGYPVAFWLGLVVWIVIAPILVVCICSWQLLHTRLIAFRFLHDLDIFIHIYCVVLAPFGEFVKVDTLTVDRPGSGFLLTPTDLST